LLIKKKIHAKGQKVSQERRNKDLSQFAREGKTSKTTAFSVELTAFRRFSPLPFLFLLFGKSSFKKLWVTYGTLNFENYS
jgi:hypothetical protein